MNKAIISQEMDDWMKSELNRIQIEMYLMGKKDCLKYLINIFLEMEYSFSNKQDLISFLSEILEKIK